ncbi:IclR family transcriptional regulator [Bacillus sp. Marseille-P3661]|uniref:IclR family transcriptional regulator n=1 Tax=Bacillus sp. Marseille-P3661 TaxID=1936234 RepID=UPI0015E16C5E|nr:IclR family transcriptional regulator [Bacillus sp. Marseille-P3661]
MLGSIKNAINIINCFSTDTPELGVIDLAAQLNMNKSTVHHVVKSLTAEGILVKTKSRKYRLGSQLLGWGHTVTEQYKPFFMTIPYLDSLVKRTKEIVILATLENEEVCCLAKIEPNKRIKFDTKVGARKPLHCSGAGKLFLAHQSEKVIKKILSKKLEQLTENTITDPAILSIELEKIREQGYAIDNEESEFGLFSVSVPIYNFLGEVICSVSISGPEFRMSNKDYLDQLISQLLITSQSISTQCDF